MKDIYVYDNSDVLINLRNFHDASKLNDFENRSTSIGLLKLQIEEYKVKSLKDIFYIHSVLFDGVYYWAGSARLIDIEKPEPVLDGLSVVYSHYKNINIEIEKLDNEFQKECWNDLSKSDKLCKLVYFISKLWQIHPFREGNTRSVSALFMLFIRQIKLKFDNSVLNKNIKYFRNALVMASIGEYSEPQYLEKILGDALLFKTEKDQVYKTINNYKVDKYSYSLHKIKE